MIDFRSDTVTQPTAAMRQAMLEAEVGDDVYQEDPTINALEAKAAALLGKEAGLFVTSGTQSNLLAILAHCGRGDEYLVGQQAHAYKFEGGGAAVLGSVQPQPVMLDSAGMFDLDVLDQAIKRQPSMYHFAHSTLLCLENTHDGKPLPRDYIAAAQALGRTNNLGLHLDGARMWNASVYDGQTPAESAAGFDTVSVCLSKGLGAPVGSVLVGPADLIEEARRYRKMVGGGMRQAGILAAAGIYALDHNIERLSDDHRNAQRLAEGLARLPGVSVDGPHTATQFVTFDGIDTARLVERVAADGVLIFGGDVVRFICHLDISAEQIEQALDIFGAAVAELRA